MNPYESPEFNQPAIRAWSRTFRILRAIGVLGIIVSAILSLVAVKQFRKIDSLHDEPVVDQIKTLFWDWRHRSE